MVADFDTTREDKNPPTLLSLNVLVNGETTSLVPPGAAAEVRFRVQDAGDMGTVSLFYHADGDWSALPLMNLDGEYTATLPGFANGTHVSLRIVAQDAAGNSLHYEVVPAFVTGIPSPIPVSPADGWITRHHDIAFSWSAVLGASGYQFQLDCTTAFTSPELISTTLSTTSYTTTLSLGSWYWRVRALPEGEWTAAWQLRIAAPVMQLTIDTSSDYAPAIAQASDGTLWVVWASYRSGNDDLWYKTSTDGGASWSAEQQWTRFMGYDRYPALAALGDGAVAVAWDSDRAANYDIWFGIFGQREDTNPPPHVSNAYHLPSPNPDSDDTITLRTYVADETAVQSVQLVWRRNDAIQPDLTLYDDGAHNDYNPGDGWYGGQLGPFPAGTHIAYQVRATDSNGNTVLWPPAPRSFQVLHPFTKTADILFVADRGLGNDTSWLRSYYTQAFDDGNWRYDLWDVALRGAPDATVLDQYTDGAVVWANPDWSGCLCGWYDYCNRNDTLNALRHYLDGGGRLFLSGQDVGSNLHWESFYADYLHAQYVQNNVGLYRVNGVATDPIGDGLALGISGGDGANNQYSPDEIDPIAPAVPILTYDSAALAPLAEPRHPQETPSAHGESQRSAQDDPHRLPWKLPTAQPGTPGVPPTPCPTCPEGEVRPEPTEDAHATGILSSGTAALRVDTGTYKVVYFAFGFEAINRRADRALVMERVLSWLRGVPPRPMLLSPADGSALPAGEVCFSWSAVLGASGYQFQLDRTTAFTSPELISTTLSTTSYTTTLSLGSWYWRVRALPEGEWTAAWQLNLTVITRAISLSSDWNLISFDLWPISGTQVITDVPSVLHSIAGQYSQVLGFDPARGGLTFDPALPRFSTLKSLDPLHGYWIKMTSPGTLTLQGQEVPITTSLPLAMDWNLVSYLPDASQFVTVALASIEG